MLILKFGHGEMVSCKRGAFNDTLCLGNLFRIDKKKGTIIIYKNKECFKHVWSSSTKSIIAFDVSPVCTTCAVQTHTQNTSINTLNLPFSHNSQKISGEKYWNREKSNFTGDPPVVLQIWPWRLLTWLSVSASSCYWPIIYTFLFKPKAWAKGERKGR